MSQFEIIFVRHGEAESSFGTHPDPALSKNGIKQSLKLIEHNELQSLEDYVFISSPKLRAIETAKPIANKFDKKIDIDETFIEIPSKNIEIRKKHGSFSRYIWSFVGGKPFQNSFKKLEEIPAKTKLSNICVLVFLSKGKTKRLLLNFCTNKRKLICAMSRSLRP